MIHKIAIVNTEVGRIRQSNQMLNGVLASLNLPAALEESADESLPQSLKDKSRVVRQAGGVDKLHRLISDLPSILKRNRKRFRSG